MAEQNYNKGIVKGQRPDPEPFTGPVNQLSTFGVFPPWSQFRSHVPEKAPEEKDLHKHPACYIKHALGILEFISDCPLDPGEGFVLSACRGDTIWHRCARPFHDSIDDAHKEYDKGQVWYNDSEKHFQAEPDPQIGNKNEHDNRKKWKVIGKIKTHLLVPRTSSFFPRYL